MIIFKVKPHRKARVPFSHLKNVYGETLEKQWGAKYTRKEPDAGFSEEERQKLREEIKARVRRDIRRKIFLGIFSIVLTFLLLAALIGLLRYALDI